MPSSLTSAEVPATRRWRIARRLLLAAAALVTLSAVFYAVENWRGKRAWESCRRDLEARGEVLDWGKFIPGPVPDDQNFYKAPNMQEWFVKASFTSSAPVPGNPFTLAAPKGTNLVLAEVKIAPHNAPPESQGSAIVLSIGDSSAREQAA